MLRTLTIHSLIFLSLLQSFFVPAQTLKDTGLVNELNAKARELITAGDYLGADSLMRRAKDLAEDLKFQKGSFYASTNSGVLYWYQANYPEALKHYLGALKIAEQLNDKVLLARALANVGLLFSSEKEFQKSLDYNLRSLQLKKELKDMKGVIRLETNIATIYKSMGDKKKSREYFENSLTKAREKNDSGMIGLNLSHIGDLISEINEQEAKSIYAEALSIAQNIGDKVLAPSLMGKIARIEMKQEPSKARELLTGALHIVKGTGQLEQEKDLCLLLSEFYILKKDWQQAHHYYKLSAELRDSIFNEEKTRALVRSEMNFGFEKKEALAKLEQEKKDLLAREELDRQKRQRNYFITGFGLMVLMAALIFIAYSQKKKANEVIARQKKEVEDQKLIVESQKHLLEEHQKEIMDSIEYAKRIQYALLAGENVLQNNLPEHFVLFKPKDVVSGDFYWAAPTPEGFLYIAADCTGHGVPGAFMSLLNISKLSQAVNENKIYRPDKVLNYVRSEIIRALNPEGSKIESKDGMDAVLCKLDLKNMKLEFAAANNSFYLIRNGQLIVMKADKMPVGKGANDSQSFTFNEVQLQKGDVIYTFTDGYADQFGGPKGKKFKYKQLEKTFLEISSLGMIQQRDELDKIITNWRGNLEQVDDICIIGVRV